MSSSSNSDQAAKKLVAFRFPSTDPQSEEQTAPTSLPPPPRRRATSSELASLPIPDESWRTRCRSPDLPIDALIDSASFSDWLDHQHLSHDEVWNADATDSPSLLERDLPPDDPDFVWQQQSPSLDAPYHTPESSPDSLELDIHGEPLPRRPILSTVGEEEEEEEGEGEDASSSGSSTGSYRLVRLRVPEDGEEDFDDFDTPMESTLFLPPTIPRSIADLPPASPRNIGDHDEVAFPPTESQSSSPPGFGGLGLFRPLLVQSIADGSFYYPADIDLDQVLPINEQEFRTLTAGELEPFHRGVHSPIPAAQTVQRLRVGNIFEEATHHASAHATPRRPTLPASAVFSDGDPSPSSIGFHVNEEVLGERKTGSNQQSKSGSPGLDRNEQSNGSSSNTGESSSLTIEGAAPSSGTQTDAYQEPGGLSPRPRLPHPLITRKRTTEFRLQQKAEEEKGKGKEE